MKQLLMIFFMLCLNFRHLHATPFPVSQGQLAQSCYPGSPMLQSDMCWGQIHSPGPWQSHQPMPWMGGWHNPGFQRFPGYQQFPRFQQFPNPPFGGPINMGDGIGDGTWGNNGGTVRCMAIGCDPRDQFRYPELFGERPGVAGFYGSGAFNGARSAGPFFYQGDFQPGFNQFPGSMR